MSDRLYGAYRAKVADVTDPEGRGRVKVTLPGHAALWARLATPSAARERGSWFVPDPRDEVLVVFEQGDPRRPYVVGALWNSSEPPPEAARKTIRSRSGVAITFDDTAGHERLVLETPAGQKVTVGDGPGEVRISDASGNSIELAPSGITIRSTAKVSVQASTVDVAAGTVTVEAGMSRFSGVVQCDTLITNSVVASSYTPGAGNVQ